MKNEELIYRLALTKINGLGPVRQKKLLSLTQDTSDIFKASKKYLMSAGGISANLADMLKKFRDFDEIEKELIWCQKNKVKILQFDQDDYPLRLKQCSDGPAILFYKGQDILSSPKMISIIGTRLYTDYGKRVCEDLIESLKPYQIVVVSGLAYGIDIIAHKSCIKNQIPTVGVMANGLTQIYPSVHSSTARDMLFEGGLMTEYFSNEKPEKRNFPSRNRIVAGLCDATIIIETDVKGGSMITADIAHAYNRELFCFPGRSIDVKSSGCNLLIRQMKAQMITKPEDLVEALGWSKKKMKKTAQRNLFVDLNDTEMKVYQLLNEHDHLHLDEILLRTDFSTTQLATVMLSLEMQGLIKVLPGKLVSLI
ncbi:MAG: DNA-protecting protein DprA [Chitinophagaceae bacterium]|nr:DNA-protecting protein DprA [Chitinophagaceae bacterium]